MKRLLLGLTILSGILGLWMREKELIYGWEKLGFFEVVFGFLGCMGLIFLSEFLGKFFLSRRRSYYGDF
jgi:hypothetical protein